jgi:cell division septation protein DedD
MKTYTIDAENSITAFATKQEAGDCESFGSQQELTDHAAKWPANRLVEVWNGIPGLTPVKKFKDQKSAVASIWKAIQSLDGGSPAAAVTTATATPKRANKAKAAAKQGKKTTPAAKAKPAKAAKGKPVKARTKPAPTRDGSKKAVVLGLLQRKGGATLAQIMKATDWQAHSVRGFISGALGKKMGLTVDSVRREDGERVYSIG